MGCGHGATPATATTAATAAVGLERRTLAHDGGLALDAVRPACNGIMWVYQWEARQTCTFIVFLRPPRWGMAWRRTPRPRPQPPARVARLASVGLVAGDSDGSTAAPEIATLLDAGHGCPR